jgi:hypothetical protein
MYNVGDYVLGRLSDGRMWLLRVDVIYSKENSGIGYNIYGLSKLNEPLCPYLLSEASLRSVIVHERNETKFKKGDWVRRRLNDKDESFRPFQVGEPLTSGWVLYSENGSYAGTAYEEQLIKIYSPKTEPKFKVGDPVKIKSSYVGCHPICPLEIQAVYTTGSRVPYYHLTDSMKQATWGVYYDDDLEKCGTSIYEEFSFNYASLKSKFKRGDWVVRKKIDKDQPQLVVGVYKDYALLSGWSSWWRDEELEKYDPPKKKVKVWNWVFKAPSGGLGITTEKYSNQEDYNKNYKAMLFPKAKLLQYIYETEEEVER